MTTPDKYSSIQTWISYYENLVKEFGVDNAKHLFTYIWSQRGNDNLLNDIQFKAFIIANKIEISTFAKQVSSTSSGISPIILVVSLVGLSVFVVWLSLVFKVVGFVGQIKPDDVVKGIEAGTGAKTAKNLGESIKNLVK